MVRWLHISDLHFNNDDMSTVLMREELPKYLRKNNIRCDYIFCTGDIRTANASPNNFPDEAAKYLIDLCTAVGITTVMKQLRKYAFDEMGIMILNMAKLKMMI